MTVSGPPGARSGVSQSGCRWWMRTGSLHFMHCVCFCPLDLFALPESQLMADTRCGNLSNTIVIPSMDIKSHTASADFSQHSRKGFPPRCLSHDPHP